MTKVKSADRLVYLPSRFLPGVGLELHTIFGDSDHATGPIAYVDSGGTSPKQVDSNSSEASPVRTIEWVQEFDLGDSRWRQLCLQEERGYMLIGEEFSGADARLFDMITGKLTFALPRESTGAVWVPAPE